MLRLRQATRYLAWYDFFCSEMLRPLRQATRYCMVGTFQRRNVSLWEQSVVGLYAWCSASATVSRNYISLTRFPTRTKSSRLCMIGFFQ